MTHPFVVLIEHRRELISPYFGGNLVHFEYLETILIPADTSWRDCTEQLAIRLSQSGLGSCEHHGLDTNVRNDFLVVLRNTDYGRPLLQNWLKDTGIVVTHPIKPLRWSEFPCDEYFDEGWWNPAKYKRFADGNSAVSDKTRIYEDTENDFLAIGWPGFDGVMFGYRRNMAGLWAYYPSENDFRDMADNLDQLQDGWTNGTLAV